MFEGPFISENCSFFRILSLIGGRNEKESAKGLRFAPFVLT